MTIFNLLFTLQFVKLKLFNVLGENLVPEPPSKTKTTPRSRVRKNSHCRMCRSGPNSCRYCRIVFECLNITFTWIFKLNTKYITIIVYDYIVDRVYSNNHDPSFTSILSNFLLIYEYTVRWKIIVAAAAAAGLGLYPTNFWTSNFAGKRMSKG